MRRKLIVRPRAEVDLASHFLYLSQHNPQAALQFDKAVAAALKRIKADPGVGANLTLERIANLNARFYRPKGFDRYLIVYRVLAEAVYVSRILHGSQDVESALLEV